MRRRRREGGREEGSEDEREEGRKRKRKEGGWIYMYYNHQVTAVPFRDKLKHPSLSPARESAPHCSTTALGQYSSMTLDSTGLKMSS